jgi:ribonuclease P protein component
MPGILKIPSGSHVWRAKSQKPVAFLDVDSGQEALQKECLCFIKIFSSEKNAPTPGIGLGVVVSRKIGSAPVRNRIKRRLRNVFREIAKKFGFCCICLVIVRSGLLAQFDFHKLSVFFQKVVSRYFQSSSLRDQIS